MASIVITPKSKRTAPEQVVILGPAPADGEGFASIRCGKLELRMSATAMRQWLFSYVRVEFDAPERQWGWDEREYRIPEPRRVRVTLENVPSELLNAAEALYREAAAGGKGSD